MTAVEPVRVASVGIGWWSNVLADAIGRSSRLRIVSCFSRSEEKRRAFADEYRCRAAHSYREILDDPSIEGIINTTSNPAHLETIAAAAEAGKHVFVDKPIANTIADARAATRACDQAGVVLAVGHQRRRESHFRWIRERIDEGVFGEVVQAEANISRDHIGKFDPDSWRLTADGLPGGVMLQIGVHYTDVLEMLLGPVAAVSGMASRLAMPGENPDVAGLLMKHAGGAISTLSTGYASASEYYLMNVYGRQATAYYSLHEGLRFLTRGRKTPEAVDCPANDTLVEELEEFADCIRGSARPTTDGEHATRALAVLLAGVRSVAERRIVETAEVLDE